MKVRSLGFALCVGAAGLIGSVARAAGVPVTIDCTAVRTIQAYNVGEDAVDQAYLLVTGNQGGKAIDERFPKTGAWTAGSKQPAIDQKNAFPLWKGELDKGQYVLLTVALFQGKGEDQARNKQFLDKLKAAEQQAPGANSPTLASADDLKKLAEATLKAERDVVTKIKDLYSRDRNTDHYGGLFTLIVWNNDGKLVKRLDPVGLTFGEHNGTDVKIYTKLKNTRANVLVKNDQGQWEQLQLEPLNEDNTAVRVKGLENEYIKRPGKPQLEHTTDYIVELQVRGPDGKPLTWTTEDEQTGIDTIHTYWNYAD